MKIERGVRQGCIFSPDLFNLYSDVSPRELETQSEFIIGGRNLNNIRCTDDTVSIADWKRKLEAFLDRLVEESEKKRLTLNCKGGKVCGSPARERETKMRFTT